MVFIVLSLRRRGDFMVCGLSRFFHGSLIDFHVAFAMLSLLCIRGGMRCHTVVITSSDPKAPVVFSCMD